jgi:hypothetical protein
VISRSQLFDAGLTRWQIIAELRGGRWAAHLKQTVAVQTGDLSETGSWWSAVFEVGSGAALDGSTALRAAGLRGFEDSIHISVPKSARPRRPKGLIVHETRRRGPGDLMNSSLPRVRPAVAAIRAALWARSDKQAALVLAMCVQQRIVLPDELIAESATVRRHRRRRFLRTILADLTGGVQSIGELEFARLCRDFGLPEPDRQTRRLGPDKTFYLDAGWSQYDAIAEIDGVHHLDPRQVHDDAVRQNELTITNSRVLRIPLIGLRTNPGLYLSQLSRLLQAGGWPGPPT